MIMWLSVIGFHSTMLALNNTEGLIDKENTNINIEIDNQVSDNSLK